MANARLRDEEDIKKGIARADFVRRGTLLAEGHPSYHFPSRLGNRDDGRHGRANTAICEMLEIEAL